MSGVGAPDGQAPGQRRIAPVDRVHQRHGISGAVRQLNWGVALLTALAACAPPAAHADIASELGAFVGNPLGVAATASPGAEADDPCPRVKQVDGFLTLHQVVARALCLHPRIRLARAGVMADAAALGQARAAYLPRLTATLRHLTDRIETSTDGSTRTSRTAGTSSSVSLTWRALDFGTRDANVEAAADLLAAALASSDATVLQVTSAGIQAYFDVQAAEATLAARLASQISAQVTVDSVKRKEAAGVAARSEGLQAVTALARAELEAIRAEGALAQARAVLATWASLPPDLPVLLPSIAAPDVAQLPPLDAALAHARLLHPALIASRLKESAARAQMKAARAEGRPTIDLVAAEYRNGRPDQSASVSPGRERQVAVVLSLPLFEGFERIYRLRASQAAVEEREAQTQEEQQRIVAEIVQAHAALAASIKSLRASTVLFETAEAAHASAARRYRIGAADLTEVLNTQQTLDDARLQRVRSMTEWHAASLRLTAAVGTLPPELTQGCEPRTASDC